MPIVYKYDDEYYLLGNILIADDVTEPNSTDIEPPEFKLGYESQFDPDTKKWTQVKIPTCAADIVGRSVPYFDRTVQQTDNGLTPRQNQLYALFLRYLDDDHEIVESDDKLTFVEVRLSTLKSRKLKQISEISESFQNYNCKDMYVTSSLGFTINADQCSQVNIETLISMLNDTDTTTFKIYDNTFKSLTKAELQTLLAECKKNGLALYQTKFALQLAVNSASTKEELEKIEIKFDMSDFSSSAEAE